MDLRLSTVAFATELLGWYLRKRVLERTLRWVGEGLMDEASVSGAAQPDPSLSLALYTLDSSPRLMNLLTRLLMSYA